MTYPRYPDYKDSGVEWLGEVPGHWTISRLGFETWVRARLGWKGLKAEEYVDDGYVFLATPNIKGSGIDFENVNFIDEKRYFESPEIALRIGDVLLAKDGSTLGTVNVVKVLPRPATVNSSIAVISPGQRIDGLFLYYLFQSGYMEATIQRIKGGMGVPHLFQEDLNKFYIPLPIRSEQTTIVTFLDRETVKIDALVVEQERLIELLKEKRQAVISHAVTKGLNSQAPMKDSGIEWLGEAPEHWETCSVKHRCQNITDGAHISPETECGIFPFISTKDLSSRGIDFDGALRTSEKSYEYLVKSGCRPLLGDVLLSKDGTIGKTIVVCDDREFVVASSLIIIRADFTRLLPSYLSYAFSATSLLGQIESFVKGAGLPRLSIQNLLKVVSAFPPLPEQTAIVAYLDDQTAKIDTLITEAERAIDLLKEHRSALISAAVTGKIDVRGLVETEAA